MKEFINIKTIISFVFGIIVAVLTYYFSFRSTVEIMEYKLTIIEQMLEDLKEETNNVYDVLHLHATKIKTFN